MPRPLPCTFLPRHTQASGPPRSWALPLPPICAQLLPHNLPLLCPICCAQASGPLSSWAQCPRTNCQRTLPPVSQAAPLPNKLALKRQGMQHAAKACSACLASTAVLQVKRTHACLPCGAFSCRLHLHLLYETARQHTICTSHSFVIPHPLSFSCKPPAGRLTHPGPASTHCSPNCMRWDITIPVLLCGPICAPAGRLLAGSLTLGLLPHAAAGNGGNGNGGRACPASVQLTYLVGIDVLGSTCKGACRGCLLAGVLTCKGCLLVRVDAGKPVGQDGQASDGE